MSNVTVGFLDEDGDFVPFLLPERIPVRDGVELRWWRGSDLSTRVRLIGDHRAELGEFFSWAGVHTRVLERSWLSELGAERARGTYHYAICWQGRPVGSVSIYVDPLENPSEIDFKGSLSAEITYWCVGAGKGHGLVTDSVRAVLEPLSAAGVGEVYARVDGHNSRSMRLLERAGFEPDSGTLDDPQMTWFRDLAVMVIA